MESPAKLQVLSFQMLIDSATKHERARNWDLMRKNSWQGLVVWDSNRGTPKESNPFHKGIQSVSKPPGPEPPI